ncbi:MAG: aspartate kinase [Candidatus Eremiobacteraeota bacterium]|nr:aspartate kinase [Candidatus Eremiobacteraeota bacterium]
MIAGYKTAVLKFGGTSLSTQQNREIAVVRVADACRDGLRPVVICSAIGRKPDPYATDTLDDLVAAGDARNRDALLACGEIIAAALFSELLCAKGIPAIALSGGQAGILTDENFGDAQIMRVEPAQVQKLLERNVVPVVAGFQGATRAGEVTTLGRGGSDLSAVALAHALGAETVDIFTDVSGVFSADPNRVPGAHPLERAHLQEMSELAHNGAGVMHAKAAEYARATGTAYTVRGLRTGVGTRIEDRVDHERPVTGVTSTTGLTFLRIIRGDVEDRKARMQVELAMFERLAQHQISIDLININAAGVFFVVASRHADTIRRLLADLNLAVRVRADCAKLSIVGAGMRGASGVIYRVVRALSDANVEIIHSTDSHITISMLVPQSEVSRAEQAVHECFQLGGSSRA